MPLDAQQLAELIEQHAGSLRLWVRSRCLSAEDAVQEAFCKLAQQEPPPDNPVGWLYHVCRNVAEKQRLSEKRRKHREQSWAQSRMSFHQPDRSSDLTEILAAVEALEEELREVLVARLWGRLSLTEVANLCGISTATAFRRYEAALQSIRSTFVPQSEQRP